MGREKEPLLSFVVPVYKKPADVFDRCLRSLFGMSYKNIEVICVFDGPDAALEKVADRYEVTKVVIEHGGAPKARNVGYTHTKGRYISFWDADCYAKPEMARMWIDAFTDNPNVDFVYAGYEFVGENGKVDGEVFDLYLLQCGNYIATMFPIKREKFPGFDESLKAAQDWDMWLTVAERGGSGHYMQGYSFETEAPDQGSISFAGWGPANRAETIRIVKEKHGIPIRDRAVVSTSHKLKALHLAKLLGADFQHTLLGRPHEYKFILNLGYGYDVRFQNCPSDAVKVQYWLPQDLNYMEEIRYRTVIDTVRNARSEITFHLCNEIQTKKRLANLGTVPNSGIEAHIVPLPTETTDLLTELPKDFRVLMEIDDQYAPIMAGIIKDLPYIKIDAIEQMANLSDYSCYISLQKHPSFDEGIRRALLNGRHVISNVAAPYCGFVDTNIAFAQFKDEMMNRIRDARALPFNIKAQEHYAKLVDPERFRKDIEKVCAQKIALEVLA